MKALIADLVLKALGVSFHYVIKQIKTTLTKLSLL